MQNDSYAIINNYSVIVRVLWNMFCAVYWPFVLLWTIAVKCAATILAYLINLYSKINVHACLQSQNHSHSKHCLTSFTVKTCSSLKLYMVDKNTFRLCFQILFYKSMYETMLSCSFINVCPKAAIWSLGLTPQLPSIFSFMKSLIHTTVWHVNLGWNITCNVWRNS